MSLYTHVSSKEDLLNGMVEVVVAEIPISPSEAAWKAALRETVLAARSVILRHPWSPQIIETRVAPGPVMLRYYDLVIGTLRRGGFSLDLTHHALHLLGSRMLGFTQDLFDDSADRDPAESVGIAEQLGAMFPYVAEMAVAVSHDGGLGGCDDDLEFELGLDVILNGLEHQRGAA
jgi:AcrR family transcriptional regulator